MRAHKRAAFSDKQKYQKLHKENKAQGPTEKRCPAAADGGFALFGKGAEDGTEGVACACACAACGQKTTRQEDQKVGNAGGHCVWKLAGDQVSARW